MDDPPPPPPPDFGAAGLLIALFLLGFLVLILRLAAEIKGLRPAMAGQQQGAEKRETQKILLHGTTVSRVQREHVATKSSTTLIWI